MALLSAKDVIAALKAKGKATEVAKVKGFYKGPAKDGKCYGVPMRDVFAIAKDAQNLDLGEIKTLLKSAYYDARMAAVSVMDFQARSKKVDEDVKADLYKLYMAQHDRINNWDLVDRAAPHVVGSYLFERSRKPLYDLAKSKDPARRRSSLVATYYFIKNDDIEETFKLAAKLVKDKDVYVQKALGSWVREAGKRDKKRLIAFLEKYSKVLPAETIRLATEKLSIAEKNRIRALR